MTVEVPSRTGRGRRRWSPIAAPGRGGMVALSRINPVLSPAATTTWAVKGTTELADAGLEMSHAKHHAHGIGRGGRGVVPLSVTSTRVRGLPVAVLLTWGGLMFEARASVAGRSGRRRWFRQQRRPRSRSSRWNQRSTAPEELQAPSASVPTRAITPIVRRESRFF